MKFLRSHRNKDSSRSVLIYLDEHSEFTLKFFINDTIQPDADYFTDDEADADGTARHFVNAPISLSYLEFVALVGPLLVRNVAFDLALAGHFYARYTWNVGDAHIIAVRHDGCKFSLDLPCA